MLIFRVVAKIFAKGVRFGDVSIYSQVFGKADSIKWDGMDNSPLQYIED